MRSRFLDVLYRAYRERLTPAGRYLLWVLLLSIPLGMDTRRNGVYFLFSGAAGLFFVAAAAALALRPRARIDCRLPERAAVGVPVMITARIEPEPGADRRDLRVVFRRGGLDLPTGLVFAPESAPLPDGPGPADSRTRIVAARRGRYLLRGPVVHRTDPLGLVGSRGDEADDRTLVVVPRYFDLDRFDLPLGRRHQPGGVPLSSNVGDSAEFAGTREYRDGDPVRSIHWRSWARVGRPVVTERLEEYFSRIALVLDTHISRRPRAADRRTFEAAVSLTASIAGYAGRGDRIIDLLAAGPELYEIRVGRGLGFLDDVLDVLACLEPCRTPPFDLLGARLAERLAGLSGLVAVLLDWDAPRRAFLDRLASAGVDVRAVIVRDGPTREPWEGDAARYGIERWTAEEIERRMDPIPPSIGQ